MAMRCEAVSTTRRGVLFSVALSLAIQSSSGHALARLDLPNKEVDSETSPYIQGLKAKSESLRDERKRERLKAYERKVFSEYLSFEAGNRSTGKARGISEETNAKIIKWLNEAEASSK